jgi:hypothetical protein
MNEEILDEVEANFVIRMKKGSINYERNLIFKIFSCGGIGHYASRCPKITKRNKKKFNK